MRHAFDLPLLRRHVHEAMATRKVSQAMLAQQTRIPKSTLSMQLRPEPYPTATVDVVTALLGWLGKTDLTEYLVDTKVRRIKPGSVKINWMLLRILLHEKQGKLGYHAGEVAQETGVNRGAYTAFLNGNRPTILAETLLPLLAWLEIYDWREICDE